MLNKFKKNNDSLFLILLIILLSSSVLFLNYSVNQKISSLNKEVKKIDNQSLSFLKQNKDILDKRTLIQHDIDDYLKLKNLQQNNPDSLKQDLAQNSKSSDLLSILPPSEIANIQLKENQKKIDEEIKSFKEQSSLFWNSIKQMADEQPSDNLFVMGNISDSVLKTSLSSDISNLLKQEKENFSTISSYDGNFEQFISSTEKLNQVFSLLKTQEAKNKQTILNKINSLNQELYVIQVVCVVGLVSLSFVLLFVFYRKNKKTKVNSEPSFTNISSSVEETSLAQNHKIEPVIDLSLNDQLTTFVNQFNLKFNKNIHSKFDMNGFENLDLTIQTKLNDIIYQMITFSFLYSFDTIHSGKISISFSENPQSKQLLFKDNGQGLSIKKLKTKIKEKYGVEEQVFIGKSEQQIMSFLFKEGFNVVPNQTAMENNLNLNIIAQINKELNSTIGLSSKENQGLEFIFQFQ